MEDQNLLWRPVGKWVLRVLLVFWLVPSAVVHAGLPFADWVQVAGDGVRSAKVAVDGAGNCFVAGTFGKHSSSGELRFGDATLVTKGLDDVFVAKYDPDGQVLWVRQLGGAGSDSATALAVDSQGNCIVAGLFHLTAQFVNTNLTALGNDAFLAKLSPDGVVSWVHGFGSPVGVAVLSIAVARGDDLVFGGEVRSTASFGSTNIAGQSFFLCRYDPAGGTRWLATSGAERLAQISGVGVDADDNVVALGLFSGTIEIGSTTLFHSLNNLGLLLAKYSPTGRVLWARTPGDGLARFGRIALDPNGYIAVAASFGPDNYVIGGETLVSHAPRGTDSFVARYDPDGNPVWARQFGGPDSAFSACSELCTDRKGNLYATGYFSGTAAFGTHIILGTALDYHVYLLKYDPSGVLQWVRVNGREGGSNTSTVALHGEDQIFWAGIFARSIEIGDVTVTASSPEHSLFVSRLHLSGQLSARSEAGNLVLDWSTNLTDVILQSAPGLTSPDSWQPVPFPAARSGSRFVLTNSFDRPSRFFRLLSR